MNNPNEVMHDYMCSKCETTFDVLWTKCPKCRNSEMIKVKRLSNYERLVAKAEKLEHKGDKFGAMQIWEKIERYEEIIRIKKEIATQREEALDYDSAIEIWEELGDIREAARVRKLKARQKAVKVAQRVVKGNVITKTEINDSVLNRSNIGTGGDDKFTKLEKLTVMKEKGLIDDAEFKQMKKEILGK